MVSMLCHIMPLVINSLEGTHMHVDIHTDYLNKGSFKKPGVPTCTWFNKLIKFIKGGFVFWFLHSVQYYILIDLCGMVYWSCEWKTLLFIENL